MTNFDINAVVNELTSRISSSELKNIFELNDMFFFRLRTKTEGTQILVVEPGKRIHLTKFQRTFPQTPTGLCKAFRTHIKGKWLKSISQYDFDRIIVLEFESHEKVFKLIIELFGKGNVILINPQDKIYVAKHYKKMRDRDIHPGIEFKFPPSTGKNFLEADLDWAKEQLLNSQEKNLVGAISKTLNINKDYAQEICLRAKLDLKISKEDITEEVVNEVLKGVKKLRKNLSLDKLEPVQYYKTESEEIVDITPFKLELHKNHKAIPKESFSIALDEHYSSMESMKDSSVELKAETRRVDQIKEIRRKQEEHLKSMQKISAAEKEKGNLIYLHLTEIDELLSTITNARHNNVAWKTIKEKLFEAKEKGTKAAQILKKIQEKDKIVIVELDKKQVQLDFLKTGSENASEMYKHAKKAEGKMPGAQKKIDELTERIAKLEAGLEELSQKEKILLEKRKKDWYEKFHWFKSSDGLLVIAGKDQRSNLDIVKKYLEKDDLFLHAEIHGAAVVVIKGTGGEIPQSTIDEAAIFSVVYSRAWKDGVSTEDTFWVTPDQVTFSAPSGEYLAKGSFIIKGSKNQLKNIPLEIAIYPIVEEKWAYMIGGPRKAIESLEGVVKNKIISVVPGDNPKSRMAKQIVGIVNKNLDENDQIKINATAFNDLISILPGNCYFKKE